MDLSRRLLQAMRHFLSSTKRQSPRMNHLNPKKLLLTKWTAVKPLAKQKHFLVSRVIQPEVETDPVEFVEIESVFSKATQIVAWRELQDDAVWRQGWV
jgi:tryptophan-rich hypothetical protein